MINEPRRSMQQPFSNEDYTIAIYKVEKETEKAIQVTLPVSWASNGNVKTMWMPKSVVTWRGENALKVKEWFINKTERENAFHGYEMRFEYLD